MSKTILFCGNGMSGESVKDIKDMGYKVFVITEFPNDNGLEFADVVVCEDSKNYEKSLLAAKKIVKEHGTFDGVMSLCWDTAMSVSKIAEEFNLKGVSFESAEKSTLKHLRSQCFKNGNIPSPEYLVTSDEKEILNFFHEHNKSIIMKPVDNSSSKGVILVESADDILSAIAHVKENFKTIPLVLVNEFIKGTEHSVEGLMIDSKFFPTGITDRIFEYEKYSPYFVEVGDVMPSCLSSDLVKECYKMTKVAAESLGVTDGPVKSDLVVKEGKVFVLELAARLGGPRLGPEIIYLSNKTNILKAAVQQALGDKIDLELLRSKSNRGVINRALFPKPGVIEYLDIPEDLKSIDGFYDFKAWSPNGIKLGDTLKPPMYGCGDFGYIITHGKDAAEAIKIADEVESKIIVKTI